MLDHKNKSKKVKEFFETDQKPWEDFYYRNRVVADMYWSRTNASLKFANRYFPNECRVLEIGSGPGHLSLELLNLGYDVVSCDIALRMASQTRQRTGKKNVVVADICSLPFQPKSFDAIVLIGVISYVSDPVAVLENMSLLLKRDGVLLISSPNMNLLFSAINRKIKGALTKRGLLKPEPITNNSFFENECTYYIATEFNMLVSAIGYSCLGSVNIGFGRVKFLNTHVFPEALDIAISKFLSWLSRLPGFRWLSRYSFANVACFRVNRAERILDMDLAQPG